MPIYRVVFPGHKYREIILDSGGNGGTGGGLLGLALMPAIWPPPLKIAALSREGLPTRGAKRPVTQKATVFLYLLRKNERDLKISKFEDLLGQIREVFSAFPGVLKQPTAHLSALGSKKNTDLGRCDAVSCIFSVSLRRV